MNNTPIQNHTSNLQLFSYENKEIRTVTINGDPWWVLKDVCDVLEIKNVTQAADRLDVDERSMFNIGRQGEVNIINESGLYAIIIRSDKPEAKAFRKWITSVVLPQIRKTGTYISEIPAADTTLNPQLKSVRESQKIIRALFSTIVFPSKRVVRASSNGVDTGVTMYSVLVDFIKYQKALDYMTPAMLRIFECYGYVLKDNGVRVETNKRMTTVYISSSMSSVQRRLDGSGYTRGWARVLEKLPGSSSKQAMRFTGSMTRAVGIPFSVVESLIAMPTHHTAPEIDDDNAIQINSFSGSVASSRGLKTIHLKIISRVDKPVKLVLNIV